MRKVLAGLVIISLVVMIPALAAYSQGSKIGYIDAKRILQSYKKAQEYEKEITRTAEKWRAEMEKKVAVVGKLKDEIELLSDEARAKKQVELESKIAELRESDRNKRQQLLSRQNETIRELMGDINAVVENIAKKENYDYIFYARNIMYKKAKFDLTDKVIKQLNK